MGTRLRWKHLDPVPAGLNPQNAPITAGDTLLTALGKTQGQADEAAQQILNLRANTQGSAILDLSGITGVYQMSEEDSRKAVLVFINTDTVTQISLFDSQNNPARYLLVNCPQVAQPVPVKIRMGLDNSLISIDEAMITEVAYGYYQAQEYRPFKLAAGDHGDIYVTPEGLEMLLRDGVVDTDTLAQDVLDLFDDKQGLIEKGQANGYTPLGPDTKIPNSYLPDSILGALKFKGLFNGATGIVTSSDMAINGLPIPAASPANEGWFFITTVAGNYTVDGISMWNVGDWPISLGTDWAKVDNTDAVVSVNGQVGAVNLTTGDVADVFNKRYATDAEKLKLSNLSGINTGDDKTGILGLLKGFAGNIVAAVAGTDYLVPQAAIVAGTYTKVTLGTNGLATGGANATTADINDSLNRRYVTEAEKIILASTSGVNTGDQTLAGLGGVPDTRTVNGQALSSDVVLTKSDVGLANVDNTSDANKPISTATQTALNGKEPTIAAGTAAQYYRGDKTMQTLNKAAVGLSNVDNTSDANKPISTATQTALNGKEDTIAAGTAAQYYRGDKTMQTLDKTAVGLANVDNTSDANKPISTATQTALNGKEATIVAGTAAQYYRGDKTMQTLDKAAVGLANVDNTSDANKPVSTATQTALNAKENTIVAGTAAQYYRGDKTMQTLDKAAVGLANVDNTSDANKPVSTATQTALNLKANLASPALTGTPTAPTAAANDNSTQLATTAFVAQQDNKATAQAEPANPATTTSATGVMMGLAGSITPVRSGKVLVMISGDMDNSSTSDSVTAQIRTGTGAAPANGAALTGTARGSKVQATNPTVALSNPVIRAPFHCHAVVTGLALNTAVWLDLGVSAQGGGTARVRNISITAVEI